MCTRLRPGWIAKEYVWFRWIAWASVEEQPRRIAPGCVQGHRKSMNAVSAVVRASPMEPAIAMGTNWIVPGFVVEERQPICAGCATGRIAAWTARAFPTEGQSWMPAGFAAVLESLPGHATAREMRWIVREAAEAGQFPMNAVYATDRVFQRGPATARVKPSIAQASAGVGQPSMRAMCAEGTTGVSIAPGHPTAPLPPMPVGSATEATAVWIARERLSGMRPWMPVGCAMGPVFPLEPAIAREIRSIAPVCAVVVRLWMPVGCAMEPMPVWGVTAFPTAERLSMSAASAEAKTPRKGATGCATAVQSWMSAVCAEGMEPVAVTRVTLALTN